MPEGARKCLPSDSANPAGWRCHFFLWTEVLQIEKVGTAHWLHNPSPVLAESLSAFRTPSAVSFFIEDLTPGHELS